MEFQDKTLTCVDCGAGVRLDGRRAALLRGQELQERAQAVQKLQGEARSRPSAGASMARERVETTTNCSSCGKETTVPSGPRRAPGVLPGMLPAAQVRRGWQRLTAFRILPEATPRVAFSFRPRGTSLKRPRLVKRFICVHSHDSTSMRPCSLRAFDRSAIAAVPPAARRGQLAAARWRSARRGEDHRREKPIEQASEFIATVRSLRSTTIQPEVEGSSRAFREAGRSRAREARRWSRSTPRNSARPSAAPRRTEPAPKPTSSTGASRSNGSSRSSRPARSAARSSSRPRTRCARPRHASRRSTRRCAKAGSSSSTTA